MRLPAWTRHLWPWTYVLSALVLLRRALPARMLVGNDHAETLQRLGIHLQVQRWITGDAPWFTADLAGFPDGYALWPSSLLIDLVQAPLTWALGPVQGQTVVCVGLLSLAGIGAWRLARVVGASHGGAWVAGLAVQLSPYVLTNFADSIFEVSTVGVGCLAAAGCVRAIREPGWQRLAAAGGGVLALGLISPYLTIYLVFACAMALPAGLAMDRTRWRRWAGLAGAGALGAALAAAPAVWIDDDRLGSDFVGGYDLHPSALVDPVTGDVVKHHHAPTRRGAARPQTSAPKGPPPKWLNGLRRFPGGLSIVLLALLSLGIKEARPWAALAIAWWIGGPSPGRLLDQWNPPLAWTISQLPLGSVLGNAGRLVVGFVVAGAVAGGVAISRWRWAPVFGVLPLLELWIGRPDLALPATPAPGDRAVLSQIDGPFLTFPCGRAPLWQPSVTNGEALYYAGVAGQPTGYNLFGHMTATEQRALLFLSQAADWPVGRDAVIKGPVQWEPGGYEYVVVLSDRLSEPNRIAAQAALITRGELVVEGPTMTLWRLHD